MANLFHSASSLNAGYCSARHTALIIERKIKRFTLCPVIVPDVVKRKKPVCVSGFVHCQRIPNLSFFNIRVKNIVHWAAREFSLSLANSRCFIGEDFTHHQELNHLLCEEGYQHWLLYPSDKAYPLSDLTQKNAATGKLRVILLDGTWKKAFKMWQLSSNLHALPCVKLPDNLVGNYVIRKAPSENSLSTLEAGYHLLSLLEPQRDFTPLLTAFHNMIEFQIAQMPPGVFEQNYRKR